MDRSENQFTAKMGESHDEFWHRVDAELVEQEALLEELKQKMACGIEEHEIVMGWQRYVIDDQASREGTH